MYWYKTILSHEQVTRGELGKLRNKIESIFDSIDNMDGIGVFISKITNQGAILYFTPNSIAHMYSLCQLYNGGTCGKPPSESIEGFFAGQPETSWALLRK